jgi:hypothetical protein
VLADLSPMLTSLVSGLIRSPDIDVIEATAHSNVTSLLADGGATVLILPGDSNGLSEAGRRLLDDRANLRVVCLREHAAAGVVGALTVQTVGLEDISKQSLLRAIAGDLDAEPDDRTEPVRLEPSGGGAA